MKLACSVISLFLPVLCALGTFFSIHLFRNNGKTCINSTLLGSFSNWSTNGCEITETCHQVKSNPFYHNVQTNFALKMLGNEGKSTEAFEFAKKISAKSFKSFNNYKYFITHLIEKTTGKLEEPEEYLSKVIQRIDEKRQKLNTLKNTNIIAPTGKHEQYYMYIYHSLALEEETLTLKQLKEFLDTRRAVTNGKITIYNAILGIELALSYVENLIKIPKIQQQHLVNINRRVVGFINPITAGVLRNSRRSSANHTHSPPHASLTDFFEWLNSEPAQNMHPIRYAVLAHFKLIKLQPFADGNDRTSRFLLNLILLRAEFPLVIIPKEKRASYYQGLHLSSYDEYCLPLLSFLTKCVEDSLDLNLGNENV